MSKKEANFKEMALEELRHLLMYAAFLSLFFCSLTTYHRLILGQYSISYLHYGYGLVEGLIIAKMILLGEKLKLAENLEDKPLYILTLYKTTVYTIFVMVFTVCEHFLTGFFKGLDFAKIYQDFIDKGLDEVLAKFLVVYCVFILFFAFIETSRVMGESKLFTLFFSRKK